MNSRAMLSVAVLVCAAVAVVAAAQAQEAQYYVLDAFGGVHAGDGAPAISPSTPYFGFDVAADIEYIPVGTSTAVGDGIIVLDDFGGVHYGGALATDPPGFPTPYFGFDAARALVYRDIPTRASWAADNSLTLTQNTYVALVSTDIVAPDDGFILVTTTAVATCSAATGDASAQFSLNVDSLVQDLCLQNHAVGFSDCSDTPPGMGGDTAIVALTRMFDVTAGAHTVNFLGRKIAGTSDMSVTGVVVNAVFIDQGKEGGS